MANGGPALLATCIYITPQASCRLRCSDLDSDRLSRSIAMSGRVLQVLSMALHWLVGGLASQIGWDGTAGCVITCLVNLWMDVGSIGM